MKNKIKKVYDTTNKFKVSCIAILNITFGELLEYVWNKIENHKENNEMKKILNEEINITIGTNEQIGNIISIVKQRLIENEEYSIENHKNGVIKELENRQYDENTINEWVSYID